MKNDDIVFTFIPKYVKNDSIFSDSNGIQNLLYIYSNISQSAIKSKTQNIDVCNKYVFSSFACFFCKEDCITLLQPPRLLPKRLSKKGE